MRIYEINGGLFWFNEGEQPEGAKLYQPADKAAAPDNKAAKPKRARKKKAVADAD